LEDQKLGFPALGATEAICIFVLASVTFPRPPHPICAARDGRSNVREISSQVSAGRGSCRGSGRRSFRNLVVLNRNNKPHRNQENNMKIQLSRVSGLMSILLLFVASAIAADHQHDTLIVTSTNDPTGNSVIVFKLNPESATLTLVNTLPTGANGGASGNAGAVQFEGFLGAVVNYGSNSVSRLIREGDTISVAGNVDLASKCGQPVSVALKDFHAFVVGSNCAESHSWPQGTLEGKVVSLTDDSAAQIAVGQTWSAVTLKSGSVLQLPLSAQGVLAGSSSSVTLPSNANNTPLGEAFWGDILGFNPAHSPDSFALLNGDGHVVPILGPQPAYPSNAPCWLAKGAGNIWYSGNSPGQAISIFFSDGRGGKFYKSISLPGTPTDITVARDKKWLAVIYTASDGSGARVSVFSIDHYGDLTLAATSTPVGVSSFSGVAVSQ
jgi:hypothetical protein